MSPKSKLNPNMWTIVKVKLNEQTFLKGINKNRYTKAKSSKT